MAKGRKLVPYRVSIAGTLLAAREAVMAPIRPILREAGITEQQWRVLRVLVDEGSREPSRLADAALLHAPSVSRILRELLDRKLIERTVDEKDGRRSIVEITGEGRLLLEQTAVDTGKLIDAYTSAFGKDRLQSLLAELRDLIDCIDDPAAIDAAA